MKKFLVIVLLGIHFPIWANHIVGGEIEFITISPGRYVINLIQYFDDLNPINPGPPAVENFATIYVFRNSQINGEWDDEVVSTHTLSWVNRVPVPYTNIECALAGLQTSRVFWSDTVELDPHQYDNPEGYYLSWERCCRNEGVKNIINPRGTGMNYITEIPPLWKNGQAFINSSPSFFQPLSDYACINQLYYTEFTGIDRDGDSLVYSLINPLNSSAQVALPVPRPKPHIPVKFDENAGYDSTRQILGSPNLGINAKGLLTVSPDETGLYVFSVLIEEYRNNQRLGSVQRDFQMLVVDGCEPPDPPVVGVNIPGDEGFEPEIDTLRYTLVEDKCFDFYVTNLTLGETINLRAEGVNFEGNIDGIFEFNQQRIGSNLDSLKLQVCAPGCPPYYDRPFVVDLIASDDACPLPQLDTLRLTIEVEPPPNDFPDVIPLDFNQSVPEKQVFTTRITATDPDNDLMTFESFIANVDDPGLYGFDFEVIISQEGLLEADITWDVNCEAYQFGGLDYFPISIFIDDEDSCGYENPDILNINLALDAFNTDPVVRIDQHATNEITVSPDQQIQFDVQIVDDDGDTVDLRMDGAGFNPAAFGVGFDRVQGFGNAASQFDWFLDCDYFTPDIDNSFTFYFIGDDLDICQLNNLDTLAFTINVELPFNDAPQLDPAPDFQLYVNQPFSTEISATDINSDDLITLKFLEGFRPPRSESLVFAPVTSSERVSSTLYWTPECDLLGGEKSRFYELKFVAVDDGCPVSKFDTITVLFEIIETRDFFDRFLPPNVFTPNGDGMNDIFSLTNSDIPNSNLPPDNCDDSFQYISIHNRAGETIFYSEEREFSWDGEDAPTGVYFYVVRYNRTEYKNYIQLLR